ncbi:MAG: helix-turn-helix domain-containing protein [Prolixibacteraceae bacterium]|nr:helix-turn-helix domain-containing protein [Prolixibacteraceae bacterium]
MESTIVITMSVTEFQNIIAEAVDKALEQRFEPLRRRFEERMLTTKEVAEVLRVSEMTVYNMAKRGDLTQIKIGSKTMYRESEVTRIINT